MGRHTTRALASIVAIAAVTSLSAAQAPADQPAARTDENSRIAHTPLLEQARAAASTSTSRATRSRAADGTIILMAIFPRNDDIKLMPAIDATNRNFSALANRKTIRFLNINDRLADRDGKLYEGVMDDGLHPAPEGYQIWADALKPIFTELLGPPGAEDHAPPPTGDPSR